jgi:hypothetical protein
VPGQDGRLQTDAPHVAAGAVLAAVRLAALVAAADPLQELRPVLLLVPGAHQQHQQHQQAAGAEPQGRRRGPLDRPNQDVVLVHGFVHGIRRVPGPALGPVLVLS